MLIEELIHVKEQNIKSILLLRDNTSLRANQDYMSKAAYEYKIVLHENQHRVRYEYQENDK